MANRMFNQFQGSLEKGVVQLYAEIAIGASGATTLVRGKGISSVLNAGSGIFAVYLQDSYVKLLAASFGFSRSDALAPNVVFATIREDQVSTPVGTGNGPGPFVRFRTADTANANTVPADGVTIFLTLTLSNSTAL